MILLDNDDICLEKWISADQYGCIGIYDCDLDIMELCNTLLTDFYMFHFGNVSFLWASGGPIRMLTTA